MMSGTKDPLVSPQLIPPGVWDERQKLLAQLLDASLSEIDLASFVMTNAETVDARLLPVLVREFSVEEFVSPDLPEKFVRRFIGRAYELHAKKGYIEGVRLGLAQLGMRVEWHQWWEEQPKGPANTHRITIFAGEPVFDDATYFDARTQTAAVRVIHAMQRWSQDIAITFGTQTRATQFTGALSRCAGRATAGLVAIITWTPARMKTGCGACVSGLAIASLGAQT